MDKASFDPAEVRRVLQARLADLETASAATADDRAPVTLDQASVGRLSRMDALQVQAMAAAAERRRAAEAQRLRAALARLDAGEYGECVACGEEIAAKRLAVDPAIAVCIRCARGGRS